MNPQKEEAYIKKHSHKNYKSMVRTSEQIQNLDKENPIISVKTKDTVLSDEAIFKKAILRDAKTLDRKSKEIMDFVNKGTS